MTGSENEIPPPPSPRIGELAGPPGTDPRIGLSSSEAAERLRDEGPNTLRAAPRPSAWRRFLGQFTDPLVRLLLAAVAVTLLIWGIEGFAGWPFDAIVIAAIVLLNAVLGFVQETRAENAVAALARMTEATSSVVRDGALRRVPSAELVPGDILSLAEGDAVGADARLLRASALRVQEAALTGESVPVLKDAQARLGDAAIVDRVDMVFKGTAVAAGTGLALVVATGMRTEIGRIAEMLESTREAPTPLQREIGRTGRALGAAVIVIAVAIVATLLVLTGVRTLHDVEAMLLLGVSLAVAAVPEGLPAILSVTLALGVQRMARRRAIVRRLSSVETLGCATVICSDKTGTLTRSEMTLVRAETASGAADAEGVGYRPHGRFTRDGGPIGDGPQALELADLLTAGCLAGNAGLREDAGGQWGIVGDPTEAAFLVAQRKLYGAERRPGAGGAGRAVSEAGIPGSGTTIESPKPERAGSEAGLRESEPERDGPEIRLAGFERLQEIPFTSERARMSAVVRDRTDPERPILVCKGAPDLLLGLCTRIRVGADTVALDDAHRARILACIDTMSDAALRTLGVARRTLAPGEDPAGGEALERDLEYLGTVGIIDPPREGVREAVREALRAGIRVMMITGDHPRTAARIAADLGIADAASAPVTGARIEALDDAGLREAVRAHSVFARVAPAHKLRIVGALKADGHVVAMTGDGVNDAPALKAADIGVAMGITGTEVAKEAAHMILADDHFATIVEAVREGRAIFDDIAKSLRYLLSSNIGEVLAIFIGIVLGGWFGLSGPGQGAMLPLLATQILWINLLTDSWPAMAMAQDVQTDDLMARAPRSAAQRIIDARMWSSVLQAGAVMALSTILAIDAFLPGGFLEGSHGIETARTAGFTTLVFAQLFNCFAARSASRSAFHGLFANGWLWGAVGLSLLLQVAVVEMPLLNVAFDTTPLELAHWAGCLAAGSAVLWYTEAAKLFGRLFGRADPG